MRLTILLLFVLAAAAPARGRADAAASEPVQTTPDEAEVGLFLIEISRIDELANTFSAEFDVVTRWRDPARVWTPGPGEPDVKVFIDDAAVAEALRGWWPALHAVNGVGGYDRGLLRMTVAADGTATNRTRLRTTLRAPLDFHAFPFDRQVLPVHVESVTAPAAQLALRADDGFAGFAEGFALPEWRLQGMRIEHATVERVQEREPYSRVSFLIDVERMTGYYLWKIMLPMAIIVMISWIVFWMSDEGLGRRAGVSATGMLTVIAYQFVVAGSLPRFPYLTVMDRIALVALVSIAATMAVNLLVSRRPPEDKLRLDRVCRVLFPAGYAAALALVLLT